MKLENEFLCVEIKEMGAELTRIYDKSGETEVLWDGNPVFWKGQSPILFPNVGKAYEDIVRIGGIQYPVIKHGFARDSEFTCINSEDHMASFLLCSDKETRKVYPFDFELCITYRLKRKTLWVEWEVKNLSQETMFFTIGGHPAFRFVQRQEGKTDYCLKFPGKKTLQFVRINLQSSTVDVSRKYELQLKNELYPLTEELFSKDALIFDNGQFDEVWLCHKDGSPYVGLKCEGFSNFGIWAPEGAPFICLEPWAGRCDDHGFEGEISEKPDINRLEGHETFRKGYQIVVE